MEFDWSQHTVGGFGDERTTQLTINEKLHHFRMNLLKSLCMQGKAGMHEFSFHTRKRAENCMQFIG